jgi:hypothetical protein
LLQDTLERLQSGDAPFLSGGELVQVGINEQAVKRQGLCLDKSI